MITAKHIKTYFGPSIYSKEPVILVKIDISAESIVLAQKNMVHITGLFSTWFNYSLENKHPDKLEVVKFITLLSRALLSEIAGSLFVAEAFIENDEMYAVVDFYEPELSFYAINLAVKIFEGIEKLSRQEIENMLIKFWNTCQNFHPDFQAQFLVNYSRKYNIPYRSYVRGGRYWSYGWGKNSQVFFESSPMQDSTHGKGWAKSKPAAKEIIKNLGAPIASSILVHDETQLYDLAKKIGFPCVTKPVDKGLSIGVTVNIKNNGELKKAYDFAKINSDGNPVMIEKHIAGDVHRIIIARGKLWGVFHRDAPFVVGDGKSTLAELVKVFNGNIKRQLRPGSFFGPAPLDDNFYATLKNQNVSLNDVLESGKRVKIRNIPLLSSGATYSDVTSKTHPDTLIMSEAIAQAFAIEMCGIDFMSEDISKSCFEQGGFIEVNSTPGLRTPWISGIDEDEIAKVTFGEIPSRIPMVLVIASEKHHKKIKGLITEGKSIGWVCGNESGFGGMQFPYRDIQVHRNLDKILKNKTVGSIAVVCDEKSVTEYGMPVDRSQITILFDDVVMDEKWKKTLSENSDNLIQTDNFKNLANVISKTLVE